VTISFGLKGLARDDLLDNFAETVFVLWSSADNAIDVSTIGKTQASAKAVDHQFFGEAASELLGTIEQELPDAAWAGYVGTVWQLSRRVNGEPFAVLASPRPHMVKVLHGEAKRIDLAVAFVAGGIIAVFLH
jgi:hypothetical protein